MQQQIKKLIQELKEKRITAIVAFTILPHEQKKNDEVMVVFPVILKGNNRKQD